MLEVRYLHRSLQMGGISFPPARTLMSIYGTMLTRKCHPPTTWRAHGLVSVSSLTIYLLQYLGMAWDVEIQSLSPSRFSPHKKMSPWTNLEPQIAVPVMVKILLATTRSICRLPVVSLWAMSSSRSFFPRARRHGPRKSFPWAPWQHLPCVNPSTSS